MKIDRLNFIHKIIACLLFGILISLFSCSEVSDKKFGKIAIPSPPSDFGLVIAYDSTVLKISDTVKDETCYQILKEAILPIGEFNSKDKIKVLNITTGNIAEYLNNKELSSYFTKNEIELFKSKSNNKNIFVFDPHQLNNSICISAADLIKIFRGKSYDAGWVDFVSKYGRYGLHYFSIPIVNNENTKAIIITGGDGGGHTGSKEIRVLNNIKGKWKIVGEISI